jgi:chemotaxis protein MotB
MPSQTTQPIIIIKRPKAPSHGHHGGAWKVAYADFVTAMLALFIVLWLLSSSEQVKRAVGGYFTDPQGKGKDVGNGLKGAGSESLSLRKEDMNQIKNKLEQALKSSTALQKIKEHVVFTVTGEGLRVELLEGENATFFESANSHPTEFGKDLLKRLAEEIGKLPNLVTMEGHTDSQPYAGGGDYSNWELSSDRANAARRWMQQNGMRADQVTQVRGFADQSLRDPQNPKDGTNRRVTLVIQYQTGKQEDATKAEIATTGAAPTAPAAGVVPPAAAAAPKAPPTGVPATPPTTAATPKAPAANTTVPVAKPSPLPPKS